MWYALWSSLVVLVARGCTVDDSAGNYDPHQRYIVTMRALVPEARSLLNVGLMNDVCDFMYSNGLFHCNTTWSDGVAGYRLTTNAIVPRVRARIGSRYENVTYEVYADSFFEYPAGIRYSVPEGPRCGNTTGAVSDVTAYVIDDGYGSGSHATHMGLSGARLRYVKVREPREDGWVSDLIAGLDRVSKLQDLPALALVPMVVDIASAAAILVIEYVRRAMAAGVFVVSAAGNHASDACDYVPPAMDEVLTVGALSNDLTWPLSNYGECVDVWSTGTEKMYTGTAQAAGSVASKIVPFLRRGMSRTMVAGILRNGQKE
jgi:subtilisin family serine protease